MIVDQNLPQKIETKLGGEYNVESVINDDGTQTLNITSAEEIFSNKSGQIIDGTIVDLTAQDLKDTTHIRDSIFSKCVNLTSVTIPSNISTIGKFAFSECPSIAEVYCDSSDVVIDDAAKIFENSGSNKGINLHFGNNVTKVPNNLFNAVYNGNGINIKHVVIPDNITTIGNRAFKDNPCLSSVTIGENVTSIEESAFHYCYKLIEVCNLSSLNIKKDTKNGYIGWYSLNIYTPTSGHSKLVTDGDYTFYEDSSINYLVEYNGLDTDLILPDKLYAYDIYKYGFYKTNIQSLVIPDSVKNIGSYAFNECTSLANLTMGKNVISIGQNAFYKCTALTGELLIPDSVTTIDNYAFQGCTGLTSVVLGTGIMTIKTYALNVNTIKEITIKATTPPTLDSSALPSASYVTTIYIPIGTLGVYSTATNWSKYASKFVEKEI